MSSEMKLHKKGNHDAETAHKCDHRDTDSTIHKCDHKESETDNNWDQKDISNSDSEYDSDSFATPVISAGIKIQDSNINNLPDEKTPHISASHELFARDFTTVEAKCRQNNCIVA